MVKIKKLFYFPIAYYFRLFAKIQLALWKPKIIVITGSNGKTTLLHLLESQVGERAIYSHHANSTYGIPFDILGLKRKSLTIMEWPFLFLAAPFKAFKKTPKEKIYVVEADCDRPKEGKFLATLLKPNITLWVNTSVTHSVNFDKEVYNKKFQKVEDAIAHEFGYFIEYTKDISIVNGDSNLIKNQLERTKSVCKSITKENHLNKYLLSKNGTVFEIDDKTYSFNFFLPKDSFYPIAMCVYLLQYLNIKIDSEFLYFKLPPGRSSTFKGIKETTIIDSTYNATPSSVKEILEMFKNIPLDKKWLVLGDMVELGKEEKDEHERLAEIIVLIKAEKIILVGPRLSKYTYPKLKSLLQNDTLLNTFINPLEALNYLNANIKGSEILLFKGARFLEGMIAHLLQNKNDIDKLPRREKAWEIRRKKWGL